MKSNKLVNFAYSYDTDVSKPIDERFKLKFNSITRELMPWHEEVKNTAKLIAQSTNKPIYLAMSGGIDGEAVARTFIECNIPFIAITLSYTNNLNYHDNRYAVEFCKKYNIEHKIITVDPAWLYGPKKTEYINNGYKAANLYRYLQLYILETVESLGGTAILSAGEQIYYTNGTCLFLSRSPELILSFDYCERNNTLHYVNFFLHNPEIYASYMKLKLIEQLIDNPKMCLNGMGNKAASPNGLAPEKQLIYHNTWEGMTPRPKFSGFENIQHKRNEVQAKLQQEFSDIQSIYIPVDIVKQQLGI